MSRCGKPVFEGDEAGGEGRDATGETQDGKMEGGCTAGAGRIALSLLAERGEESGNGG